MTSIITKPPRSRRILDTKTGATNLNGGQIKIELDKGNLVPEHVFDILIEQTFGTNAPTGNDPRKAFSRIEFVSDRFGTMQSVDFAQAYDQMRFHENAPIPVPTYGAGGGAAAKLRFPFDLHSIMDKATLDLLTAVQTSEHGSLYALFVLADKANGPFSGGSGTLGELNATIVVKEHSYRAWSGKNIQVGSFVYGRAFREFKALEENSGTSTAELPISVKLTGGRKLRELVLHTYDITGTYPAFADGILDRVASLEIGGVEYFLNVPAETIRQENIGDKSDFNYAGAYVLPFGDDPAGWPMIAEGEEVKLKLVKRNGSPAGWKIRVAQDSAVHLDRAFV